MPVSILTGSTEPIRIYVVNIAGKPLTGLTDLYVRLRRNSDGYYLDWSDLTFKNTGWTTLSRLLTQVDATNLAGVYEVVGGLATGSITNPAADDIYTVYPLQTPGSNAQLPAPDEIRVGRWVDQTNVTYGKLPTNNIMGSSVKTDKDDEIDAILTDTADMQPRVVAIEVDTNEIQTKLPTDYIMGSAVQTSKDDEIDAILADTADMQPRVVAIEVDTNEIQTKLPTNNIMGSSVKADMDDEINAILADTAAMEPLVSANLDTTISSRASEANATANKVAVIAEVDANEAKIDTLQATVSGLNNLSAAQVDAQLSASHGAGAWDGVATPSQIATAVWDANRAAHVVGGSFGESIRLNAAGLQGDAVTEIRDGILDDGTRFSGADIARLDANVSSRAVAGDAMDLIAGAVDANALDVTAVAEIADGVWDEALSGHTGAGSTGQAQNRLDATISSRAAPGAQMDLVNDAVDSASLATSAAAEIADSVWDESLAGHVTPGTAGEAEARLDAAVSSRAAPGAQMTLTAPAVAGVADGVWDEALAGHLAAGSTGKALQDAGAVSDPNVIAAAVWDKSAAAHTTPGTMGQLENRLDAPVSTRAAPGDPMALQANSVNATSIATAGANKIRDTILSDATPFQGARIDAAISSRAAPGEAMDLVANAVDATAIDATGAAEIADSVWDEPIAGHLTAGTTGKVLNDGSNPAAIAGAVWDEALAGHVGAGSAGEAQARLDASVTSRAAPGAAMDLVTDAVDAAALSTTAVQEIRNSILSDGTPFQGARIDAAISSRAAPGAQMDLVNDAVDAGSVAVSGAEEIAGKVWDVVAAAHGTPGTTGALLDHLDADVTSRAAPGAQMALTPAAVAAAADGVWDETLAGHLSTGSTGKALSDASEAVDPSEVAAAVWDEPRASHVIPGSMGEAQEQSSTVAAQVEKIDNAATVAPSAAAPGSLLDRLCNKSGARTYDQTTDSLEGIRDRIG